MARIFLIVFFALAIGVTFTGRESFFRTSIHEEGDIAANSLQVYRAKHLQELHGNYSRWGFNHPGPAFFYVYAAGEWLLHDVTRIAPAPYNAHVYAGTLLQLAFYALAVALLAGHTRRPWLVASLAIVAGAFHYAHVQRAFFSVWPPDVLLMPFLCFLVTCAALSIGDRRALPILVVTGSFLVHGHIAQPLFVVPLAGLALLLAVRGPWRGELGVVARTRAARVAAVCLGVFLLPLILDLFAGRESNAYSVRLHLRYQTDAGQSLWQSILCYAGYFIGLGDPTMFNRLSTESYAPFREQVWLLVGWMCVAALTVWRLFRRTSSADTDSDPRRFGRGLLLFWAGASVLTLVWGMRQDGGFTSFNSHFNHSLVHALILAALVAFAQELPATSRLFNGWIAAAGLMTFVVAVPYELDVGSRGDEVAVRLQGLLNADPKPNATKLITFAAGDWYEAVTLARAFQRQGISFRVHPTFRVMFGADMILNDGDALSRGELSIWHVVDRKNAPAGAHVLNRHCSVVFPAAAALPPLPVRINIGANQHNAFPTFGIGPATDGWAWSEGHVIALTFVGARMTRDVELTLEAAAFLTKLNRTGQRVTVRVNGEIIGREVFSSDETRRARWSIPGEVWNRQSPQTLVFELPDAAAPATANLSGDRRLLGLRLYELTLAEAKP